MLTQKQKEFNYRLSRARIVVENAFGRLKARWRCLLKQNDIVTNVPKVVTACCILHNICEIHGNMFDDDWLEGSHSSELEEPSAPIVDNQEDDAQDVRQAFADYIESNPLADWYNVLNLCIHSLAC